MHHRCNKLHVDRRSAGIACRPKWVGWALVSKELTLCLLQDPSHETRRHRSYSRPGHSHSSSLGGRHLVARYLCTCQSRYPPLHATWSRFWHEHLPLDDEQEHIVNAVDPTLPYLVDHISSGSNNNILHIAEWSRLCSIRGLGFSYFRSKRCCYGCFERYKLQNWSHRIGE